MSSGPALKHPQGAKLLLHSIAPTGTALVGYVVVAVLFTVLHLITLSLDGTAYPEHLNDEILIGYTNFIIQPLLVFINHPFVNSALTLILWGIVGSLAAACIGTAATAVNDWRNTRKDVSMPRYGVVIRHPMQHNLIVRFLWRLALGASIIAYTVFVLYALRYCFGNDLEILRAASASEVAYRFGTNILIYTGLLHGYVILLRLYVQRTRLFGEILY